MIYYVAHAWSGDKSNISRAKRTVDELQRKDLANCYVCPILALPVFADDDIDCDSKFELCLDLMSICDAVIIGSYISAQMKKEIEFARLINMEVLQLGTDGQLQPFSE